MGPKRFHRPFVAFTCARVFILGIVRRQFVNTVVGQVHVSVVKGVRLLAVLYFKLNRKWVKLIENQIEEKSLVKINLEMASGRMYIVKGVSHHKGLDINAALCRVSMPTQNLI